MFEVSLSVPHAQLFSRADILRRKEINTIILCGSPEGINMSTNVKPLKSGKDPPTPHTVVFLLCKIKKYFPIVSSLKCYLFQCQCQGFKEPYMDLQLSPTVKLKLFNVVI